MMFILLFFTRPLVGKSGSSVKKTAVKSVNNRAGAFSTFFDRHTSRSSKKTPESGGSIN